MWPLCAARRRGVSFICPIESRQPKDGSRLAPSHRADLLDVSTLLDEQLHARQVACAARGV